MDLRAGLLPNGALVYGLIFGLFLPGATTTKDFADVRGDSAAGVRTLPVVHGHRRCGVDHRAVPGPAVPPDSLRFAGGFLTGNRGLLLGLTAILIAWGGYVVYLMVRRPEDLAHREPPPGRTCTS
jgi:4-hydroxybenzoate polyprenyltransferase